MLCVARAIDRLRRRSVGAARAVQRLIKCTSFKSQGRSSRAGRFMLGHLARPRSPKGHSLLQLQRRMYLKTFFSCRGASAESASACPHALVPPSASGLNSPVSLASGLMRGWPVCIRCFVLMRTAPGLQPARSARCAACAADIGYRVVP